MPEKCLWNINEIGLNAKNKDDIRLVGGLDRLIRLLRSDRDQGVRDVALAALKTLAQNNMNNREVIQQAGIQL